MDATLPELQRYQIASIYVGGGSPSCMHPDLLTRSIRHLTSQLTLERGVEKTIELMPQTVGTPLLSGLHPSGYTRFSLSMQSAIPEELEALDCGFTVQDVRNAVLFLDKFHMNNLNLDLMCPLPGQTMSSWQRTLNIACDYAPTHISIYPFPGGPTVPAPLPAVKEQQEMLDFAAGFLGEMGFRQYLNCRYALPSRECRHFQNHSQGMDYWGLGLGARSQVEGMAWANTADWQTYRDHSDEFELITVDVRLPKT
jgi:oxygen-independent coproporphyrinogen-3 oxidase